MRIGIDFDNTIVNTSVTSKRYLDKHLPGNNLNSYHDLSKNEGLDFFNKYYKDITNSLDLFDGVYEAFSFFKENNIEIALLTARGGGCSEIIDLTKDLSVLDVGSGGGFPGIVIKIVYHKRL